MRVLVSTTAGAGHFGPLVPFARALLAAGHDVLVAAPASFSGVIERAGFAHAPFADAPAEELGQVFASLPALSNEEANRRVVRDVFAGADARAALPGMEAVVREWRPDLVLRETTEFASYLVAQARGVPHVHVAVGLASFGNLVLPEIEEPLTALGAEPGLRSLLDAPTLTLVPASLEEGASPPWSRVLRHRVDRVEGDAAPLPDWWDGSRAPLVYVSFGSVAAGLDLFPAFYRRVVDALDGASVRVLLTVGDSGDPGALGPVPPHVHVERWWPQEAVMPSAAAVVGHGGFGTTLLALAAGLPMVLVPLFADQPHNAQRVAALGAAIVLDGPGAVPQLADAVGRVLADGAHREAAQRVADEIAALPAPAEAVPFLEEVARRR